MQDFSFWAEIYSRTGHIWPKTSFALVFVVGGLLAVGFWWTIGLAYQRQESALARTTNTEMEVQRLAGVVDNLRAAPTVINIPPATVQIVPAPSQGGHDSDQPKPYPLLGVALTKVVRDTPNDKIDIFVAVGNTGTVETSATMKVELGLGDQWQTLQAGRVFLLAQQKQWEYRLPLPLAGTVGVNFEAGTLRIRVAAQYEDRGVAKTYVFEGIAKPALDYLDIVTSNVIVKEDPRPEP